MTRDPRYRRGPAQSTKAVTVKLTILAVVATLLIGGLMASQMATGNDPALGPKAVARAKKASKPSSNSSGSSGYSSGSGTSGSSGYSYSPPPVTSSTS